MDTSSASEHGMNHEMHGTICRHPRHRAVPILAIIIGLEFFLAEIGVLTWEFVNVTWPLLLIVAGIVGLSGHHYHYHDQ